MLPLTDQTHKDTIPPEHQFECVLRCGVGVCGGGNEGGAAKRGGEVERDGCEVRVTCVGKKDGQLTAAQAMLKVSPTTYVYM